MKCLLIADRLANRKRFKRLLAPHFSLFFADSVDEALRLLAVEKPDGIICGSLFDDCRGIELFAQLQTNGGKTLVPFVFMEDPRRALRIPQLCNILENCSQFAHVNVDDCPDDDVSLLKRILSALGHPSENGHEHHEHVLGDHIERGPLIGAVKTVDGKFVYVTEQVEEIFEVKTCNVIGKTDHDFIHRKFADVIRANDLSAIQSGSPIRVLEWVPVQGQLWRVNIMKMSVFNKSGTQLLLTVATNVSDAVTSDQAIKLGDDRRQFIQHLADEFVQVIKNSRISLR